MSVGLRWGRKGDVQSSKPAFQNALKEIEAALVQQPKNQRILQTYFSVLIKGKGYLQILQVSDQFEPQYKNMWWVLQDRGICKAKMGDKDGALQEFSQSLNQCLSAKDDPSAELVVRSMADELGVSVALDHIQKQVQSGDPHWLMLGAVLEKKRDHVADARKLVEQLMAGLD